MQEVQRRGLRRLFSALEREVIRSGQRRTIHEAPNARPDGSVSRSFLPERGAALKDTVMKRFAPRSPTSPSTAAGSLAETAMPASVREAVRMQLSAVYRQHFTKFVAGGSLLVVYTLWRVLYGVASTFVDFEASIVEYQFLALSMASIALGAVWLKQRLDINPNTVYRRAMLRLNTHPGVLARMGAPLIGSEVRATVTTGGHLTFKKSLFPMWQAKRCQMIFPLTGAERRGLVSVEAKKWHGNIVFKLISVDVRDGQGSREESRLYIEGDSSVYNRGGVMRELRDPFLHALESEATYVQEDEADEAAEEAAEEMQRERARPKDLDQGGGMYAYERMWYGARDAVDRVKAKLFIK